MAYLGENFDANTVEPSTALEVLPPGDYVSYIRDSEMKSTKKGDGQLLQMTLEVIDGPHKGKIFFDRLNLDNPNPVAVEIARKTLSAICRAVGVMQVRDSTELHRKPLVATLDVRKQENYSASNEVKGYKAYSASGTAPASVSSQPASAPAAAPWAS